MDTFTFMVALILMMMAVQYGETWMVLGVVFIMMLTMRSISATVLLIVAMAVLYIIRESIAEYWIFVFFGLVILSLIFGLGKKPEQPAEYYPPEMYGGMMGGM